MREQRLKCIIRLYRSNNLVEAEHGDLKCTK
jgi:hypothetical protein